VAKKRFKPAPAANRGSSDSTPADHRVWLIAIAVALAGVTIAAYTPVWQFAFVALDDPQYVYANANIAKGLTADSIAWALKTGHEANWHPLTWMSHALDISLFGLNSGMHHLVGLLFHVANTLLLFAVLRRFTASIWPSAFVAALFAVHPLHVESVAWVAERKDVLSSFFFMLTLGAYARYVEQPSARRYWPIAACLALGLMAKAMLVTVPLVLLLLDYWPLGRIAGWSIAPGPSVRAQRSLSALFVEKLPLFAIVAASSAITFAVQRAGGAVKTLESFPLPLRVQNAIVSYVDYLKATAWPVDMGVFYPFPPAIPAAAVAISAGILLILTVGAALCARRAPAVAVGWFWFIGMLVPVIGLVQIGGQARADRYMYLPMIGIGIAVAWGFLTLVKSVPIRQIAGALAVLVMASYAYVANVQVQYWRDTVALWSHTGKATDHVNNFGVYFGLAEYLRANGRAQESIPVYEKSIARNSAYLDSRLGLVRALVETRQNDRAITELQSVIAIQPAGIETRMSLALLLGEAGRTAESIAQFSEAVRLSPDDPAIRNDYAHALAQNRQFAEAAQQWEDVIKRAPAMTEARLNLAIALLQMGRLDDAAKHLREVLRQDPANETAKKALAAIGR